QIRRAATVGRELLSTAQRCSMGTCRPYSALVRFGFSSTLGTAASRHMYMSNETTARRSFGWILSNWSVPAVFARKRSTKSARLSKNIATNYWRDGMSSSVVEGREVLATRVDVTKDALSVELADGRTIIAPLAWYPRLAHATPKERKDWRLIGRGL